MTMVPAKERAKKDRRRALIKEAGETISYTFRVGGPPSWGFALLRVV